MAAMRAAWCLCAALASLALGVAAADEVARVQLRGRAVLPGVYPANQEMATTMPKFLRDGVAGAHALLQSTQGSQTAYIVQQGPDAGNFEFADVPEGIYRLEVRANGLAYPAVRVEVDSLGELTLWLADMNHKPLAMNGDRFEIAALGLSHMYELRQSTNVLALLRNPVVLVMLGGVGLMWLLTKCVDFDELKREVEAERRAQQAQQGQQARPAQS